jgi:hypothetical protein
MKGEITLIKKIRDENENVLGFEAVVEFSENPKLRLGEVELKQ